jgi:hypothetical protein
MHRWNRVGDVVEVSFELRAQSMNLDADALLSNHAHRLMDMLPDRYTVTNRLYLNLCDRFHASMIKQGAFPVASLTTSIVETRQERDNSH